MKKTVAIILTLLLFVATFTAIPPAQAATASLSASGGGNITPGQSFTITVKVSSDFNVSAVVVGLQFDSSKLERKDVIGANGFGITPGPNIVCTYAAGKSGNFTVFTVVFQAKSAFAVGESTVVNFTNAEISSSTEEVTGKSASVRITMNRAKSTNNNLSSLSVNGAAVSGFSASKTSYDLGSTDDSSITIAASAADAGARISGIGTFNLAYNKNTFTVAVTAENGATKTYRITINKNDPRSKDNSLASLTAAPAEFRFDSETLAYTLFVDNSVSSLTIDAQTTDALAVVEGIGAKELAVYSNVFEITVTAENETVRVYRLNVVRRAEDGGAGALSADNKLRSLKVEGYEFPFNPDVLEYGVTVPNEVDEVSALTLTNSDKASVSIVKPDTLEVGANLIKIIVTAESTDIRTYTIIVTRKDETLRTNIGDLEVALEENGEVPSLTLEITDDANELTADVMELLKNSGKSVAVEKYVDNKLLYKWELDSNAIVEPALFNTYISFGSQHEEELAQLADYADIVCLDFSHSGELPAGTKVSVYVGNRFLDGSLVNLYHVGETQIQTEGGVVTQRSLEPVQSNLLVAGGYVTVELSHCSEYVATRATLNTTGEPQPGPQNSFSGLTYIFIAGCGLLLMLTIIFAALYIKEKKHSEAV